MVAEDCFVMVQNEEWDWPGKGQGFWLPDIIIDQVIDIRYNFVARNLIKENFDVRTPRFLIEPSSLDACGNGSLNYAQRMNFDVKCNMDFRKFPFDSQTCDIIFHSFAYSTDDYTLQWKKSGGEVDCFVNDNINLALWNFEVTFNDTYDMKEIGDEEKPGLIVTLKLQRLPYYHILMFYLPALLFAIVAYLTHFIPPVYGIGLRSGVNILVLLSIFALNNGVKGSMPLVSYATFIDIWMFACFLVVFFALFQHSLIFMLISSRRVAGAKTLEVVCRFLIPVAFLIFVAVYIVLFYSI